MKRLLPHLLWLCLAVAAYLLGAHHFDRDLKNASAAPRPSAPSLLDSTSPDTARSGSEPDGSSSRQRPSGDPANATPTIDIPDLVQAASGTNPIQSSQAMADLLAALTSENAPEILGAMFEAGADQAQMGLLVYAWGALDGPAALAFADQIPDDENRVGYTGQVVKGWASTKPEAAMAWVDGLPQDERTTPRYRWNLIEGLADGDLDTAAAYALDRANQQDRGAPRYMGVISERMVQERGVTASLDWAETLPQGPVKNAVLNRVANGFVENDPRAAAEWAAGYLGKEEAPQVIHEVADEWAERDPAAAVAWLETLPDGDAKAAGLSAALSEWVKRGDAVAASEYLVALTPSPQRDAAVASFASTLASSDPASAVTWAESIQQENFRHQAIVRSARAWMRQDPVAASAWLQGSQLSSEIQQRIAAPGGDQRDDAPRDR